MTHWLEHLGPYSPTVLQDIISLVLHIFFYIYQHLNVTQLLIGWNVQWHKEKLLAKP